MEEQFFRFDEINPKGLLASLLKNLWIVVALCISAVLCYSSVCQLTHTPTYTSTATFMVSAKDSTSAYNSLTTTQSMASVFMEVFQSNALRQRIDAQMPGRHFDGSINCTIIPETNLLIVTATSSEPDVAFRALKALVENYESISDYIFANAQLEVIKDPIIPVVPSNPLNVKKNYPIVLALAALLSVSLLIFIYIMRDTVKNPKAARRKLDSRLLRTIDHEQKNKTLQAKLRRKNIAPLITNPLISKRFTEDNLSLCSMLEYHTRKRDQKVIVVTSIGENEGKSTIAANLALSMVEKNKKVALLDCDFRKPSLHKIFEIPVEKEQTLTTYLLHPQEDLSLCLKESKKHGVFLGLSHNSGKHITQLLNNGKLQKLLLELRSQMDYVILDTPPMLVAADSEAIAAMADTAVLVVREDFMPISSINEGLERLQKSAPDLCGFVLNNHCISIM